MKAKHYLIIGGILTLLVVGSYGVLFWQLQGLRQENRRLSGQLDVASQSLTESLQRAETEIAANRDQLDEFAQASGHDLDTVKKDLETLGARLEAVATTIAQTRTVRRQHQPSDEGPDTPPANEVPVCPTDDRPIDVHRYTQEVQHQQLEDSNGMRVADVSFDASSETPWSDTVWGIRYRILNTIGETEEGTTVLHTELLAENPEAQPGEVFRIEGVESRVLQAPDTPRFDWWDPGLFISVGMGIGVHPQLEFSGSANAAFSVMSYGDWRFIGVTTGLDAANMTFMAAFFPFSYNVGGPLPLVTNLHIFPYVGIDHTSEVSVGIGLGVRL